MKLNKPAIKKWIKALRSGKYRQGQGRLCKRDFSGYTKYCCLGVVCKLAEKEGKGKFVPNTIDHWSYADPSSKMFKTKNHYSANEKLPKSIRDWLGISYSLEARLVDMNDDETENYSFNDIADFLEKKIS